ncbi:MAG: hypothetical protein ORN54_12970 [Cyclobacteriaceae bacterium]|nr:hypothetical protein [Cyclobacteriaceae bacterium]
MAFEIDILITYTEKDNEIVKKSEQGWVTQFKKFLELMLLQVLGTKPNIVIKSEFDTAIAPALGNAAILVSILTKEFAQSDRCLDIIESFYKATAANTKTNRFFKVLKSPLTLQEQPSRLRDSLGYEMYQLDDETGAMKEYSDFFSPEAEKQYWMKMVDLAYDIHEALIVLKDGVQAEVKNIYKRKTIYLAESGHDLAIQRNIIKRELIRHGYVVLPKNSMPMSASEIERSVRKDMEECSLSIHLIGSSYGEIPDGSDRSVVDMQNRISADCAVTKRENKQDFSRLIWITQNLRSASDRQKSFIETLKRDAEAQEGAEILQNPLEDFKNIIREELLDSLQRKETKETKGKSIYLVHDKIDHDAVKPFQEAIEKLGFKILSPAFEGELLDVRKQHIDNLRNFDGAIIFKGKINDQWVRMKVLDLLKAPGFGREKPIQGKALVGIGNLEAYRNQNITIIPSDSTKAIDNLKNFLQIVAR